MRFDSKKIKDSRIFIIEGIAGSGKDTVQDKLSKYFEKKGFIVNNFSEEELLFSWKHFWIKDIEVHRIKYLNSVLDYCEKLMKENKKNMAILNRFHISFAIFSRYDVEVKKLYDKMVNRLQSLPVQLFIGKLGLDEIGKRTSHVERKDRMWRIHQQKRIKLANVSSLFELYKNEQELIFKIAKKQGIPYSIFKIEK